jgi:hypothetical protein
VYNVHIEGTSTKSHGDDYSPDVVGQLKKRRAGVSNDIGVIGHRGKERNGGWSVDCFSRPDLNTRCFLTQALSLAIVTTSESGNRKEKRPGGEKQAHIAHVAE